MLPSPGNPRQRESACCKTVTLSQVRIWDLKHLRCLTLARNRSSELTPTSERQHSSRHVRKRPGFTGEGGQTQLLSLLRDCTCEPPGERDCLLIVSVQCRSGGQPLPSWSQPCIYSCTCGYMGVNQTESDTLFRRPCCHELSNSSASRNLEGARPRARRRVSARSAALSAM